MYDRVMISVRARRERIIVCLIIIINELAGNRAVLKQREVYSRFGATLLFGQLEKKNTNTPIMS